MSENPLLNGSPGIGSPSTSFVADKYTSEDPKQQDVSSLRNLQFNPQPGPINVDCTPATAIRRPALSESGTSSRFLFREQCNKQGNRQRNSNRNPPGPPPLKQAMQPATQPTSNAPSTAANATDHARCNATPTSDLQCNQPHLLQVLHGSILCYALV